MPPLTTQFPHLHTPPIINAPMADNSGGLLAATVTLAGGLGLVGSKNDMNITRGELSIAREKLAAQPSAQRRDGGTLCVGVGFLPFLTDLNEALSVVQEFKPAVVWLFAARSLDDYAVWAAGVRRVSPLSRVWVQVGSVAAAVQIARLADPDAICMQGADAGGHGYEKGAGIISLLPEAVDALAAAGYGDVAVLASGGVMDGRGVAAAVALGAQGVVMGTRFLASKEAKVHPVVQASILEAVDGGQVTIRSKVFDQLRGPNVWPEVYDGRSLVVKSYRDFVEGVGLEEIQKAHNEALNEEDKGWKVGRDGRAAIWAGSGVGLATEVKSAAEIVEGVRNEARRRLSLAAKF